MNVLFFLCPVLVTCWLFCFHICFFELKIYLLSFLSPHSATSTLLILAVCRTQMSNMNLVYGLTLHEFSVAQVDRVPVRCLGGHRFESCQLKKGLRFFLCPKLVMTCWLFHFHINLPTCKSQTNHMLWANRLYFSTLITCHWTIKFFRLNVVVYSS